MASIEFEVYCECGEPLNCKEVRGGIEVEPCPKCLEDSYEEGYSKGEEGENG